MSAQRATVDTLRPDLLELHRAVIDAQRIHYERSHGRVETSGEFLGLVLNHPDFDWIRALSALIARMDEWSEAGDGAGDAELEDILATLRDLLHPQGGNRAFTERYWRLVDDDPDVTVPHVKVWRLLENTRGRPPAPGPRPSARPEGP